jgi:hypothetical protein
MTEKPTASYDEWRYHTFGALIDVLDEEVRPHVDDDGDDVLDELIAEFEELRYHA